MSERVRDAAEAVIAAWNEGWDCSRSPGHHGLSVAIDALAEALAEWRRPSPERETPDE